MLGLITAFSAFLLCGATGNENVLNLTVYYETLCPDSTRFFRNQLKRAYEKAGSAFNIDFVPYGFAMHQKKNGKWTFNCQHGERECSGNKYHACELAQGNGQEKDVKFLHCSMSSRNPASTSQMQTCAESAGIDFSSINDCVASGQGDEFLAKHGDRTKAVTPKIKYIPTIIINDVYNQRVQSDAEFDLLGTICQRLEVKPPGCSK